MGIEEFIKRLHEYTIKALDIKFIDRDNEVKRLLELLSYKPITMPILVGPVGCGKSEFIKAFTYASKELIGEYVTIYLDLREGGVIASLEPGVRDYIRSMISREFKNILDIPVKIHRLFRDMGTRMYIRGRSMIIFLDELKYYSRERDLLYSFISELSSRIYNIIEDVNLKEFHPIAVLNDQYVIQMLLRDRSRKISIYLMWNLDIDNSIKLLEKFNVKMDIDTIWQLTGGNISEILAIIRYKNDIRRYISSKLRACESIYAYARDIGVEDYLARIVYNIDYLKPYMTDLELPEYRLTKFLYDQNIVITVDSRIEYLSNIPTDEPWIGNINAFQIPAYYWCLKTLIESRSYEAKPDMVMKMMREYIKK